MAGNAGIVKNIIHSGYRYVPIKDGCKVHFHFQTWRLDPQRVLLDDSRKIGKKEPMVMIIGHKFKLEVWETVIKMMAVGEIASFRVKQELVFSYPFVAKTLRELDKPPHKVKHSCTMSLHQEGLGYADLDGLINHPSDLEFIFELLKVEREDEYEKEIWQLNIQERIDMIPELKEKGNLLYGKKMYDEAEEKYKQALGIIEQLMIRERKGDEEWINLNNAKLPLLLNYAQCKLVKCEYYPVIEHCTYVLQYDRDNEKALYRRGKAHMGAWNPEKALADFYRLKRINPSMKAAVDKEIEIIHQLKKDKSEQDKDVLKNLFQQEKSAQ
ncbi:AH receptor-interacting protein [Epargyreus clarus]|uniref:AH receptor-interacting protein n=1 Tax=Epargyreus clarus TaxID=520877 RepID=UPI003C2E4ACF